MDITECIAKAIKKADNTYFFENYSKQAKAVIKALEKEGFVILPKAPSKAMIDAGSEAILSGRVKPGNHVVSVYMAMLSARHDEDK